MTQLTLNIENPAILPALQAYIRKLQGVTIVQVSVVEEPSERDIILSSFRQVKGIQEGTVKTRSIDELLNEY